MVLVCFLPFTTWQNLLLLLFSPSVMSYSLQPHVLRHARLPCPSVSPGAGSIHVHWVSDAIQPSHPLLSPSPPALSLSQHQGLCQWVSSSHHVAKVLELQLQPFQWIHLWLTDLLSLVSMWLSRVFSSTTSWKHQFFGAQLSLWSKSYIHTWPLEKP